MAASESMTDEQAYAVAANTVRVWMRERNERHLANVKALSCPEVHDGTLAIEINAVKGEDFFQVLPLDTVARFTRNGSVWTLDAFRRDGGAAMFTLQVRNGELLVCQIGSAPVP
jgi:sulfur transfer protein SufE